ncbi:hypothetical protein [Methanothrix sp.]|uniref:hypothetical protein n=1 Tax=Methanothrix sp. TaxID=90426 RepID=UPI003BB498AA
MIGEVGHLGFWQRLAGCNASCLFVLQDLSVKLIAAGGFEAESISISQGFLAFKEAIVGCLESLANVRTKR